MKGRRRVIGYIANRVNVRKTAGMLFFFSSALVLCVAANGQPPRCDDSLNDHVYHPERLSVLQKCIAVTGTIVDATHARRKDGVRKEADGDTHGWLKVDKKFRSLLNAGNMHDEDGNLVFEIICKFPVTQKDAKASCQGFKNRVTLPPVGSRVRMIGRLVQETNHGKWIELHPVTSIRVIRKAR